MGLIENQIADINVTQSDDAVGVTNLNLAVILTDETPNVTITNRTKEYYSIADIATEWGDTSKVYKAAAPHFGQAVYVNTIKIGRRITKGTTLDDEAFAVVSNVCTVTSTTHGLSIGDEVTNTDSSGSPLLNGIKIIVDVPTANTFTFAAAGVSDDTGTLDYHTGDASLTVALDDLYDFDSSWLQLLHIFKDNTSILEIAAWTEGKPLLHGVSVENIDIYDSNDSADLFSQLQALNYENTWVAWYHLGGVDAAAVAVVVASEVATVTKTNHGLRVGDFLTMGGATPADLNGNKTVASVTSLNAFTFAAVGVADGSATGTINYFARYGFLESGVQSYFLAKDIGSTSWSHKPIKGFISTPNDILKASQAFVIGDRDGTAKGGNWHKGAWGGSEFLWGRMTNGRTIKVQSVAHWLQVRLQEAAGQVFKTESQILYTKAGRTTISNALQSPLGVQLSRGGITPYNTSNNWLIVAEPETAADKAANTARYTITVRNGAEILSIAVNVSVVT